MANGGRARFERVFRAPGCAGAGRRSADLSDLSLLAVGDLSNLGEGERPLKFLRWCMQFAPEQWNAPDDLARLFREAVRGGAARDEIVATAVEVYRDVAARYPAQSDTAAHFQAAFEEWMASEACPHADCHERFDLACHSCGNCGEEHRWLVPGPYGIFHRRCQCGTELPTFFLTGRHHLASACPCCHKTLDASIRR